MGLKDFSAVGLILLAIIFFCIGMAQASMGSTLGSLDLAMVMRLMAIHNTLLGISFLILAFIIKKW